MSQASVPQESVAARPRVGNSRVTVRYRCPPATLGRLFLGEDHEFQRAWVVNMSQGGVGVLVSRPVPVGISVVLRVRAADCVDDRSFSAQVIHCTLHPSGEWLVGCEFGQPLTPEGLESML